MKDKLFIILLCIFVFSCSNKPNLIGKWEVIDNQSRYVSEFKEKGIVLTDYYNLETNKKLNPEPLELEYSVHTKDNEWFIDFNDVKANRKISSQMKLINNDTLITYSKETIYKDNDSITSWKETIHTRIKSKEKSY